MRRQEEMVWLREQGFTRVVSLLVSPHNLHAYEEMGLVGVQYPIQERSGDREVLAALYPELRRWLFYGERVLVHQEELGDQVLGVVTGYLRWTGLVADPPRAVALVERITRRQLGAPGRALVGFAESFAPPTPIDPLPLLPEDDAVPSWIEALLAPQPDEEPRPLRPAGRRTRPRGAPKARLAGESALAQNGPGLRDPSGDGAVEPGTLR